MTDRKLALCFAFLIPIIFTVLYPFGAIDLSIWIAAGRHFLETGTLLRHDTFSVLPTSEFIYPDFLATVIYALLYPLIGLFGVCLFHGLIVLPVLLWTLYSPLIKSHLLPSSGKTKWFLFVFWLGAVPIFRERPAMLALIPLVFSYQIISKIDRRLPKRDAITLIIIEVIWANLHGSFVLLPLMLAWKLFFRFPRIHKKAKEFAVLAATIIASGLNSFGFDLYPYLLNTVRISHERGISEWAFPGFGTAFPTGFLYWLVLGYFFYILFQAYQKKLFFRTLSNPYFLLLFMGTLSIRNSALTFVLLLPAAHSLGLLGAGLGHGRLGVEPTPAPSPDLARNKSLKNLWVFSLAIIALPLVIIFKPVKWDETVAFPLTAAIKADGRTCAIFNDWELGSFLVLETPNPIYLDTRNVIFTRDEFESYKKTINGETGWDAFLDRGQACFVMVNPRTANGLIAQLKSSGQWEMLAEDNHHVLYAKKRIR